jgi:hypothetical protein
MKATLPLDSHKVPPFSCLSINVINNSETKCLFGRALYDNGIFVVTNYTLELTLTRLDSFRDYFIDRGDKILSGENLWRRRAMAFTKNE